MTSGCFAVVFNKMKDEEKLYALKCFTKEQEKRKRQVVLRGRPWELEHGVHLR